MPQPAIISRINSRIKGSERNLYVLKSFSASFIARAFGLLSTLIITPLVFQYLGTEEFGLWSVMIGFGGFLTFADLGLSNGLLNFLIKAKGENNFQEAQAAISTTFKFITVTSLSLICVIIACSSIMNWKSFFNTEVERLDIIIPVVAAIFLLNVPLMIIQKIEFAWMHNHFYHYGEALQKILLIIGIFLVVQNKLDWYWLVVSYYLPNNIINFINILFYSTKNKELSLLRSLFNLKKIDKIIFRDIFKLGILFLLMSITYMIGRSLDKMVIAYFGNLEMVTNYEILSKPFETAMVFIMMLTSTLWSAFGDAISKKDFKWINKTLKNSLILLCVLFTGLFLIMFLFGNTILGLWLNSKFDFELTYFAVFGVWTLLLSVHNVFVSLLNAANILKFQIYTFAAYAILSLGFKIFGLLYFDLTGFVFFNLIAFLLIVIVPVSFKLKKLNYLNY